MNLKDIYQKFKINEEKFNHFLDEKFQKNRPLLYLSCDIRHSGNKLAVIDSNLYPAGFNNLCKAFTEKAILSFQHYLESYYPQTKRIVIFTEAHTRNKFYFENLFRLAEILTSAGKEVKLATVSSDFTEDITSLYLENNKTIELYQLKKNENKIFVGENWIPDLIISNNDFSSGIDPILLNIEQPVIPPLELGWYQRRKSNHFELYNQISEEVGELIDLDPWMFSTLFTSEKNVDLTDTSSMERLAKKVDETLSLIQKKQDQYHIQTAPYVFVKNNSGTYGMGVTYVTSGEEILNMNRKLRNKMGASKGGNQATEYIIQEGIITADSYSGYPIEPVIYMVGKSPIGGFFRLNELKDEWSSLNTKGMAFACLCLHKLDEPHEGTYIKCQEKEILVQSCFYLAQIAALAAAKEVTI